MKHNVRIWDKAYIKRVYNLSVEECEEMFKKQNGCCGICKNPQTDYKSYLCIDHNHETGKIRGLLCRQCNSALGHFKDDPQRILKAIKYLESFYGPKRIR